MKEEIINWLKYDRSWTSAMKLFHRYGHNLALKATLNRQGETPIARDHLYEQLRSLSQTDQKTWNKLLQQPVKNYEKTPQPSPVISEVEKPAEVVENIDDLKKFMPESAKKAIRLRDEFPFFKQPDCPTELKILVSDMLTVYDVYRSSHEALFTAENEEQLLAFSKETVEKYLENRQIWEELNHYKKTGKILGKHPIFDELNKDKELQSMSAADLGKMKGNLRSSISRLKKSIESGEKPDLNKERTDKVLAMEATLQKIERILAAR